MYRFFRMMILVLVMVCALTTIVSAENASVKDPAYNFKKIAKIYVDTDVNYKEEATPSDIEMLKIRESLEDNKKYVKKFEFTHHRDLADAVVTIEMLKWGETKYWHEPTTEMGYETITKKDKDGKTSTISIPVPKTKPGYYTYMERFSARYILTDKDGRKIYEYMDSREDEKYASAMFGRATKDFYKSLNNLK